MSAEDDEVAVTAPERIEKNLEAAAAFVREHDSFLVVSHVEPDGDAIGSTLGLAGLLEAAGNDVIRYNRDPVPYSLDFLAGAEALQNDLPDSPDADAIIVLDTSDPDRIGSLPERAWDCPVAVIDHHDVWEEGFGDVVLRDPDAAATAQLVYHLADHLRLEIDRASAEALYCGLMTDTGSFQYSNTSTIGFRVAGELLAAGVEPWEITCRLYEQQPVERIELLAEVLGTLRLTADGRLAFIRIDGEMVDGIDRVGELTDGFINYGRSIDGVEVSTQLRELDPGRWKVSFRSKGNVDVSKLAKTLGGGGHENAAGCTVDGDPDEIERRLTAAIEDLL